MNNTESKHISDNDLVKEITALANAEYRRHKAACSHTSLTVEDLISDGWLASQKALGNYDPDLGELLHYLRRYIKRELSESVRVSKYANVSVSARTIKRLEQGQLSKESTTTLTSLRNASGIAVGTNPSCEDMDAGLVYEMDVETIEDDYVEDIITKREEADALRSMVDHLASKNARYAQAITLLYGLDGTTDRSYDEVADIMNITVNNLKQIHKRAMKTLRQMSEPSNILGHS
jgi:RNA polymerase sigma factor (sigma-70 family)